MTSLSILITYICLLLLQTGTELLLDWLNLSHLKKHADQVPELFQEHVDFDSYRKSQAYTRSKALLGIFATLANVLALVVVILSGLFGIIDDWLYQFQMPIRFGHSIAFVFVSSAIFSLVSLPFSLYSTFVIEQRFGFNTTTIKLWIRDRVIGIVLSLILLTPLLYAIFWFMQAAGQLWWLYAFLFVAAFQLVLLYLYPVLIAPLFNKFSPLPAGSLRDAIMQLADQVGFKTSGIFCMDGSKRSAHGNAYFTGFGANKRIVLFDTLITALKEAETVAVLAHEIGHQKLNHIKKSLVLSVTLSAAGFFILSLLLNWPALYYAFGFNHSSHHAALVVFLYVSSPVSFFLAPLSSSLSRKFEYEADNFAVTATGSKTLLANALLTLNKKSLGNLTPHPWYSFFHYSHPTVAERILAMRGAEQTLVRLE